jgi:group I intron endonuclease
MTLPKTPGIYKITNTVNGRFYIGSAVNLARRWTEHQQKLRRGKHANSHLQRSWLAHGGVVFGIEILEHVAALSNLIGREQFWIDRLQASGPAGYNLSPTAHSVLGYRHSPETRKRISEAKAGLPMPPHVAAGLRAASIDQLAVKHSVTTRCVRDVLKYFTWRVDIDLRSFDRMPVNFNQQETPQ